MEEAASSSVKMDSEVESPVAKSSFFVVVVLNFPQISRSIFM